ncbi:hypothetical protein GC177_00730 [bacterium]|nr:hypothetical protein [bacterium]
MVLSTAAAGQKVKGGRRIYGARKKAASCFIDHYRHRQALQHLADSPSLSDKAQQRLLAMLERCEQRIAMAPVLDDESLLVALKYLLELVQEEVIDNQPTVGEMQRITILNNSIGYVGLRMMRSVPVRKMRDSIKLDTHVLAKRAQVDMELHRR